jgi:hypothetical protein
MQDNLYLSMLAQFSEYALKQPETAGFDVPVIHLWKKRNIAGCIFTTFQT